MTSLLLTILSTSCIFIAFKSYKVFKINTLHAIITNYFVCVITGIIFLSDRLGEFQTALNFRSWYVYGILLGIIFIITFLRMSRTAQEISVAASSMASKLALVIPVLFSLIVIQRLAKDYNWVNYLGIALTIPSLVLASWPEKEKSEQRLLHRLSLPLSVFILSGVIDTSLNFFNSIYESDKLFVFFPLFVFFAAASTGTIYAVSRKGQKEPLSLRAVIGGIYLGVPNYFSLYFLLETLKEFNQDGAFIFPLSNLGTILLSSIAAMILFSEKLSKFNIAGLIMSIISLLLIAYQEFLAYV